MIGLLAVAARALAVAAAWAVAGAGLSPSSVQPDVEDILALAVRGSHEVGYRGTQTVLVWGGDGSDAAVLHVVAGSPSSGLPGWLRVEVDGSASSPGWVLLQRGLERTVYGLGGGPLRRAPADLVAAEELDGQIQLLLDKYTPALEGPVTMLGRDAWKVRIVRTADQQLVERWTVDAATGVLLEREGFERHGRLERKVSFDELEAPYQAVEEVFAPPARGAAAPAGSAGAGAQEHVVSGPEAMEGAGFDVPDALPAGYRLRSGSRFGVQGALDDPDVVHLTYSDGLEPLSLFRQPGLLRPSSLPSGAHPVELREVEGYAWEGFPRGLAWQDGDASFVLMGAASTSELEQIAGALPQGPMRRSLPDRVGHLLRWLRRSISSVL